MVECMSTSKISNLRKATLEALKPENELSTPPTSPPLHSHPSPSPSSIAPPSRIHSPAFSISPPASPRLPHFSLSLSQSSLSSPRFTTKSPSAELCSLSPSPSPKLSSARAASTENPAQTETLSPPLSSSSHLYPYHSSPSHSPSQSPRRSTTSISPSPSPSPPCLSRSTPSPSPPASPSIPVSPALLSPAPNIPAISFRCISPSLAGTPSPRSPNVCFNLPPLYKYISMYFNYFYRVKKTFLRKYWLDCLHLHPFKLLHYLEKILLQPPQTLVFLLLYFALLLLQPFLH